MGTYAFEAHQVALDQAKLKLDWTKVYAPTDGYISNLYLKEGAMPVPGQL